MEAKTVKNLSAALVCIFIFAVMILAGGLTYYYRHGVENAEYVFSSILERVTGSEQGTEADTPFDRIPSEIELSLNEAVDLNTNLAALSIKINGAVVYARPEPSQYFTTGPDGVPAIGASTVILKSYEHLLTLRGSPVNVSALIYILQPVDIFKSARIAFLMVLAATLAAIILLVYLKLYPVENPALTSASAGKDNAVAAGSPKENPQKRTQTAQDDTAAAPAEQDVPITPLPPLLEDVPPVPEAEPAPQPLANEPPPPAETPVYESKSIPKPGPESAVPPSKPESDEGIYSPETGLIRERYLSQGLASALSDAETGGADLALFIIAIPGLDRTSSAGKLVSTVLGNYFKTPALIYEYKESDFAAIVPGSDFDKAVQTAEKVYVRLNEILVPFNPEPEVGIGISNRLNRVVSASRLISESDHAVEKALSDPENPIVALKINMDKYRKYSE